MPFMTMLLALACGVGSTEVMVPPDESLTLAENRRQGIADLESDWTKEERATARSILRNLADQTPTQLPRFASARSGRLFEKLVHEEFDRREDLEGPIGELTGNDINQLGDAGVTRIVRRDSLAQIYAPDSTGCLLFDREAVELSSQALAQIWRWRADIETHLGEVEHMNSSRSNEFVSRYQAMIALSDGVLVQLFSQISAFAVSEHFSSAAKDDAVGHLMNWVPKVAPSLAPEPRAHLDGVLQAVSKAPDADPRLAELSRAW